MKSMTGYAKIEKTVDGNPISFEIKSYNNRYLDMRVNLPFWLSALEPFVREYFCQLIFRGSVDICLKCFQPADSSELKIDYTFAKKYNDALKNLAKNLNINYIPDIKHLVEQPGVLGVQENANIEKQLAIISKTITQIETESLNAEIEFKETITKKFYELLSSNYDENRILQEVATMLVKYTIEEELVRFCSHLQAIKLEIKKEGAIAKRLDFICQEMNREINTIASKTQNYKISSKTIIIKEALENIREQLKNLE